MADEKVSRKDYFVDDVDYYHSPKDKEIIEQIIEYGGKEFLKDSPDAIKVRKWLNKKRKEKGCGWNVLFYLEQIIIEESIIYPKPVKISLWDEQDGEQRKARVKRNKKALEVLINEIRGETQFKVNNDSRGNEFYSWCSTVKAMEKGECLEKFEDAKKKYDDELLNILSCMYGVVINKEQNIKRQVKKVHSNNRIFRDVANKIFSNLDSWFGSVDSVEGVIQSCLSLIFSDKDKEAKVSVSLIRGWIANSKATYNKNKK